MNSQKIREMFLSYFETCGHTRHPSASLVPAGDPSLLFTNAGMVPFKNYFLGIDTPSSLKMCTSQKCIRAGGKHNDLEQVGLTARHHTFFEMLGHFVFRGANKETAIKEAWVLLTEHYKIPKEKLWVTVYHEDTESRDIWQNVIGLTEDRVISCGQADNFWSMGDTGPCGPCTEIFYDHGDHIPGGLPGTAEADGDRYVEVWNLVFMQYEMLADGSRVELESMGLDTGMGIERLAAVMQDVHNNYDSDLFTGIIKQITEITGIQDKTTCRVIADHIRASVFLISDQVYPSNEGRGYVLRRIIRRATGYAYREGYTKPFFFKLVSSVIAVMKEAYPELVGAKDLIEEVIKEEEKRFQQTIDQGMKILQVNIDKKANIDGDLAFMLYDTYGFPLDIAKDMAKKHNLTVDEQTYHVRMSEQKTRSRQNQQFTDMTQTVLPKGLKTEFLGYENELASSQIVAILVDQNEVSVIEEGYAGIIVTASTPFYAEGGGQVGDMGVINSDGCQFHVTDTKRSGKAIVHIGEVVKGSLKVGQDVQMQVDQRRRGIMNNHSATHLLHAALRMKLGNRVVQKGSLVAPDRLRFDFTYNKPLTTDEIVAIEVLVNDQIRRNYQQVNEEISLAEAKERNIMALFGEKYEDPVRVVRFGDFSAELCGGTHVAATGEIGLFKILQETGIASGVRRIEAITGSAALEWVQSQQQERDALAQAMKCDVEVLLQRAEQMVQSAKSMRKQYEALQARHYVSQVPLWLEQAKQLDDHNIFIHVHLEDASPKSLRGVLDSIKASMSDGVVVLSAKQGEDTAILVGVHGAVYQANNILKGYIDQFGGRGGGKPGLAQGVLNIPVLDTEALLKDLMK